MVFYYKNGDMQSRALEIYIVSSYEFFIIFIKWFCSYGKTKDVFGWPEETEEAVGNSNTASATANSNVTEQDTVSSSPIQMNSFDK